MAEAGLKVIDAVLELLDTFRAGSSIRPPEPGQAALSTLTAVASVPTGATQYRSLAMLAATVRWLSHEAGREESAILDDLVNNYR
jgi:hypothetical protein